jgi:hypothetical protein
MNLLAPPFDARLPRAYGSCGCLCHRIPGVSHIIACYYPPVEAADDADLKAVPPQDRIACRAQELPSDLADSVENARMDPQFNYLNALLPKKA